MGNLWCAREHSVQFFVQFFFYTIKLHSLTLSVWGPLAAYVRGAVLFSAVQLFYSEEGSIIFVRIIGSYMKVDTV